jgi:hypothetical protein
LWRRTDFSKQGAQRITENMSDKQEENLDSSYQNRLYPDDQAKVDEFISRGVNSVERKPFRPMRLLILLMVVVIGLSILSQFLARWSGIY